MGLAGKLSRDHEVEVPCRVAGPTLAQAGGKSSNQRMPPEPATGSRPFRESASRKPPGDGWDKGWRSGQVTADL
jgi:hypothetical protein